MRTELASKTSHIARVTHQNAENEFEIKSLKAVNKKLVRDTANATLESTVTASVSIYITLSFGRILPALAGSDPSY